MSERAVPVIDIAPFLAGDAHAKTAIGTQVDETLRRIGFLIVAGHGVDPALIARMHAVSHGFFALPLEEKNRYRAGNGPVDLGYIPSETEGLSYSLKEKAPPDLKETFAVGRVDQLDDPYFCRAETAPFFQPIRWPDQPAELRQVWSDYYRAMSRLGQNLLRVFATALDLDERYFFEAFSRESSKLLVRHYADQRAAPKTGQLRAGAHTDFGTITILAPDDAPGGLQVRDETGAWHDCKPVPGSFIVNIGDLMARWTNDRWVSTLHRVVNPPVEVAQRSKRQTLAFFQLPNPDAIIAGVPTCVTAQRPALYPPVGAGAHYLERMRTIREMKNTPDLVAVAV
jgi:isopenicillin N synthase-like dioxygenase